MNNSALAQALTAAHALELDLSAQPSVVLAPAPQPVCALIPPPPRAAARGFLHALWLRVFGPPPIDPGTSSRDCAVFRALYEVGSDYLPSSGTWPSSQSRSAR